jgi:nucleotide-binding universal stress UspA family protein
MPVQHILVPLDYSASADRALAYAIEFAKKLQARVTLLHVIDFPPRVDASLASYQARLEADTRQALAACLQRVHAAGVQGNMLRVHGTPCQGIVEMAKETGADLIIMGTQGRTGLPHLLLGSVAERVVRLAPCPVLVTHPTASDAGIT